MEETNVAHVMVLPFPAQGHIKPMLKLAELLNQSGLQITFVNTDYYHNHIMSQDLIKSYQHCSPKFSFSSIPDGLPLNHQRAFGDVLMSLRVAAKPAFHHLLISSTQLPTCIIADDIMSFAAMDVAEELGIPVISFATFSASSLWNHLLVPKLIEDGEVPFPDGDLDKFITCIPGFENVLRRRDLSGICRIDKADNPFLEFFNKKTSSMTRARGLILNTFDDLEAPAVSRLSSIFLKTYPIGPLHVLSNSPRNDSLSSILWNEDKTCMKWLDSQASRSVIYVSFGSLVNVSRDQMFEFWYGLVNSGKPFLWVIRPDLIVGESGIDPNEVENIKQRSCIVSWAPQEEVLAHPAVGGFLTHSGWNSVLESIVAGVPMIGWPQLADQLVNSRCVSEVWKLGFDMKDSCDRLIIEKLVRDLIDRRSEEIIKSADEFARLARDSVKPGGSSYVNLEKLVEDIKSMVYINPRQKRQELVEFARKAEKNQKTKTSAKKPQMEKTKVPHVLILSFPAQGHIKPMMKLADLLNQAGLQITFVNTDYYHNHLMSQNSTKSYHDRSPKFSFTSISDGLPLDHPRPFPNLLKSITVTARPAFYQLLVSLTQRPTCIISDGVMSFAAIDAAEELGIPVITFRTFSASGLWAYFLIPKLIEQGHIPFLPDGDMDKLITCIPGFENILRRRDLPGVCRVEKVDHPILQFFVKETETMTKAYGLILNTFDELEAPVVSNLSSVFSKVYTIGPLHTLNKSQRQDGILWKEDRSCTTWLDSKSSRSVIYVSFGSLVNLTSDQVFEFWYGLVNSEKPFLWVIRPDLIVGESGIDLIELEMVKERGCVVSWAPQEEVLDHPAVGGFLTHAGWNSTLESIVAGVPMICWPNITEQFVNSRCVSEVWKLGFDMKDICDRLIVEKLVRDLIDGKCEEIVKSANSFARLAEESVKPGGSSYVNLEKLVEDIKSMDC